MNKTLSRWHLLGLISFLFLASCGPVNARTQPATNALETIVATTLTAIATDAPAPAPTETSTPEAPAFTHPRALQVAYIKDRNVYIWTEGEGKVGLTSSGDAINVRISDDGQVIAYVRQSPNDFMFQELWAVNTSGPTNARLLVSHAELETLKPPAPFLKQKA